MAEVANLHSRRFFLERMAKHDRVDGAPQSLGPGLFAVGRTRDLAPVTVFYSGAYRFSLADVETLPEQLGEGGYVLIMEHCDFTAEAKAVLRAKHIGIGRVRDFMGALNLSDVAVYDARER